MIPEVVRGSTIIVESTLYLDNGDTPANLAGAEIFFICKARERDADSKALFQKTVGNGITVISEAGGTIETLITATDLDVSNPVLFYEVVAKLADANSTIVRDGVKRFKLSGNVKHTLP